MLRPVGPSQTCKLLKCVFSLFFRVKCVVGPLVLCIIAHFFFKANFINTKEKTASPS
ncbi:hypothetical protein HanRHA438_Chr14g0632481 [Helianthus annuus]|nr:hypothetical protein HanRHA438_Chr14g0632481 [Helianthus annuus]